ncbi:MAG: FAD:protein FMN transferase [Rhizobiaceae bacterium]
MNLTRRRFIAIAAAATVLPGTMTEAIAKPRYWTGQAMGARASLTILGLDQRDFRRLTDMVRREIARLERMFSLYLPDSDLVRLNSAGRHDNPPADLVRLLSLAGSIHRATGGMFDPTVQPLWLALAASSGAPAPAVVGHARNLIGFEHVEIEPDAIRFRKAGMAMTLNGIAQGYATDRVAAMLRGEGLSNVLVSVGEIAALGVPEPGRPWRVGISETEDGAAEEQIALTDMAIATSAPAGMRFGVDGNCGHILDPAKGASVTGWRRVSVIHPSAAVADGLSTAFCGMSRRAIIRSLARYPGGRSIAVDRSGNRLDVSS